MPHDDELALWAAVRTDTAPAAVFRSTGKLSVAGALAIYKNAYWARQHAVLSELFPRVEAHLGDARFRELVRRYLLEWPSVHPELERLGVALPAFMRGQPDDDLAGAASIATYEQALLDGFLAPDSRSVDTSDVDPERFALARLRFLPSLRIVELDEVLARVLAREGKQVVGARAVVVARPRLSCTTHCVASDELELLELARRNARIGELLEMCDHDVARLHLSLSRWFHRRWIATLCVETP